MFKFMFDNIGNICSNKKISDTLTSMNRKISNHTSFVPDDVTDIFITYVVISLPFEPRMLTMSPARTAIVLSNVTLAGT